MIVDVRIHLYKILGWIYEHKFIKTRGRFSKIIFFGQFDGKTVFFMKFKTRQFVANAQSDYSYYFLEIVLRCFVVTCRLNTKMFYSIHAFYRQAKYNSKIAPFESKEIYLLLFYHRKTITAIHRCDITDVRFKVRWFRRLSGGRAIATESGTKKYRRTINKHYSI